jgi:hypothetical protein
VNHVQAATQAVKAITDLLVEGDYRAVERMTDGRRLTADQIEQAVLDYGNTLVPLPPEALDHLDVYTSTSDPRLSGVEVDLWTREEGRSDLTLEVMLESRDDGGYDVSVRNIHVM